MRLYLMTAVILAQGLVPAARAEFVLTTALEPASEPGPPVSALRPVREPKLNATVLPKLQHPLAPRFRVAEGFGHDVPLRFAVRQIVPPAVRVTYGPGANSRAAVDWQGGSGWNQVLANAVRPLGLHLVMTYMAVEVAK